MSMTLNIPHSIQRLTLALAVAFGLAACETAPKPVEPEPAPTVVPAPIVTPGQTMAPPPSQTSSPMLIGDALSSPSRRIAGSIGW